MKKFFKKASCKINNALVSAKCAFECRKAEGYVDTGVKVLMAVVLGALVLSLLYGLINSTVMPKVTEKVNSIFTYTA